MTRDPLITEKEAARRLGLHPDTLKSRRLRGHALPHIAIGCDRKSVIRYAPEDVDAYILQARRVNTRPTTNNAPSRQHEGRL